jgi:hypothetical protein
VSGYRTREGRSRRLRTRLRGAEDVTTFEIGVAMYAAVVVDYAEGLQLVRLSEA